MLFEHFVVLSIWNNVLFLNEGVEIKKIFFYPIHRLSKYSLVAALIQSGHIVAFYKGEWLTDVSKLNWQVALHLTLSLNPTFFYFGKTILQTQEDTILLNSKHTFIFLACHFFLINDSSICLFVQSSIHICCLSISYSRTIYNYSLINLLINHVLIHCYSFKEKCFMIIVHMLLW